VQLVLPQCLGPPSNHRYNPDYQPSGTFDDKCHRDRRGAILAKVVEVVLLSVVVLVLMLVLVVVVVLVLILVGGGAAARRVRVLTSLAEFQMTMVLL
jgi:hypothetical protein